MLNKLNFKRNTHQENNLNAVYNIKTKEIVFTTQNWCMIADWYDVFDYTFVCVRLRMLCTLAKIRSHSQFIFHRIRVTSSIFKPFRKNSINSKGEREKSVAYLWMEDGLLRLIHLSLNQGDNVNDFVDTSSSFHNLLDQYLFTNNFMQPISNSWCSNSIESGFLVCKIINNYLTNDTKKSSMEHRSIVNGFHYLHTMEKCFDKQSTTNKSIQFESNE